MPEYGTQAVAPAEDFPGLDPKSRGELEELFLRERPLREMKRYFEDWQSVLSFHARNMSQRFAPAKDACACKACGSTKSLLQAKLQWRAHFGNARTALVTLVTLLHHSACLQMDFFTHHTFCQTCYSQLGLRKTLAELARYVSFALVLLFGGLLFVSFLYLIVLMLDVNWQNWRLFSLPCFFGAAGLSAAIWARLKLDQWCVPPTLRLISKPPFVLYALSRKKG